jgi:hypothetical protein
MEKISEFRKSMFESLKYTSIVQIERVLIA